VNKNLAVIREMCTNYRCILGGTCGEGQPIDGEYFVVMLLRNDTVKYIKHEIVPFYTSKMSRTVLQVQVCILIVSVLRCLISVWQAIRLYCIFTCAVDSIACNLF